jgi:hypothetical protein
MGFFVRDAARTEITDCAHAQCVDTQRVRAMQSLRASRCDTFCN